MMSAEETLIRIQMMKVRRLDRNGNISCDMCRLNPATDRHHIVTRYATMGNEQATKLANQAHMTAALCQECHGDIDTDANRETLLQKLYRINGRGDAWIGYTKMKVTLSQIADAGIVLLWELPHPR
jgi:hypothetical protein